jgi:hypothetical protein
VVPDFLLRESNVIARPLNFHAAVFAAAIHADIVKHNGHHFQQPHLIAVGAASL